MSLILIFGVLAGLAILFLLIRKLARFLKPRDAHLKYCPHCGMQYEGERRYCNGCGGQIWDAVVGE